MTSRTDHLKQSLLAASICAAISIAGTAAAQMATETSGASGVLVEGGGPPILYDQTDNGSGNGAPDQDFEAGYDTYDAEGADDFVVTDAEGWTVLAIDTIGTTGGVAASVNINILDDNGGAPGNVICSYPATATVDTAGSLSTTLPTPCPLPGGNTYWLTQQTQQDFATQGQHFWSNRTVQTGNPGHWQNPGDGFGSGCTTFTPMTTCGVGGGTNPDFLFAIRGVVGILPPPPSVPALNSWGLIATALVLIGGAGLVLRRRKDQ